MQPRQRIPLHNHGDSNSGGLIAGSTVVLLGGGTTESSSGTVPAGTYVLATDGGEEVIQAHGALGATETIDLANGNYHSGTLDADCTFTFAAVTSGVLAAFTLELTEDGTGGWDPTWPGSVTWIGGSAPTHDTTAATTSVYGFWTTDGGTNWIGFLAGSGSAPTFATPAIVLGTAAAAGAASTVIRSDATIVAFDATAPTTAAFGDAAATGSAAYAARRDHVHGMPSAAAGEILILDTPAGSPLVFADLIQNEAGTDLLYQG